MSRKEKQPLSVTHPQLAQEAFGWDPNEFTFGSNQKLTWKCKIGHQFEMLISSRTSGGYGCPICSSRKILPGFNDLATTNPLIASQAFGWNPSEFSAGSGIKLNWKCSAGHIFKTSPFRRSRGDNCPICSGKKVLVNFNDLATTHPHIALEAYGIDPITVTAGSQKRINWLCPESHLYKAPISRRTKLGTGCPYCSGQKLLEGFNDLFTKSPNLALEAEGWNPKKTFYRSNKKLKWKCSKSHVYFAQLSNRQFHNSGCPYCAGKKILKGYNDLQTLFPALAIEANGWNPAVVSPNSHKNYSWRCSCGHVWSASPNHRVQLTRKFKQEGKVAGCARCAGKVVISGENDLLSVFPEIAQQAHGWDPGTFTFGSQKLKDWICPLGHLWKASISNRTNRKSGCPVCENKKLLTGFNDLKTMFPNIASELISEAPETILSGTHKKVEWKCSIGHKWRATVSSRTSGGNGCPTCSNSGFDPNEKGFLYFIEHPVWEMNQIGITNVPEERLKDHSRNGWEVIEIRGPMDGHLTQQWETAILRMLKAKGADLSNSKIAGKFDGYSEAWSKSTFPVKSIKELMRLTEEFEEKK